MQFLEKDLEQIIFETPIKFLQERGLYIHGNKRRQLRIGNYGVCDLITLHRGFEEGTNIRCIYITIYELKQQKIGTHTLLQAARYAKGIQMYFSDRFLFSDINVYFRLNLIGRSFDVDSDFIYLPDFMDNLNIITYNYDVDGISFRSHNDYHLLDSGF